MNKHDKLFKEIESVKENAADLIRSVFPKEILNEVDLDSLLLDNNSYVDKNLKEHYTDLVYNCKKKITVV
ncbi:MAG: Rpn family recombination-promoting nuclease/putative transposase [Spirochaetes bacterium]|nr:Rpn family recombination-promoting nuclease/putative transposase [Spirochaetota bacterium]